MQPLIDAFCARCNGFDDGKKKHDGVKVRARTISGAIKKATITCNCKPQPTK